MIDTFYVVYDNDHDLYWLNTDPEQSSQGLDAEELFEWVQKFIEEHSSPKENVEVKGVTLNPVLGEWQ